MGPDPSLTPELVGAQSFTTSFRGYDPSEVRSFLGRVATQLRELQERCAHLESAWHSAEERAARPPVLDEDTLMAAVGEETASILRAARAAAADLRTRAGEDAAKTLEDARQEAGTIKEEARGALAREKHAAEEAAERIVSSAQTEAAEVVDKARVEADQIRGKAETDRALTIEGANATRDRILDDLSRRRRVATVQIEQLRAGRERLIESYAVVRRTLEEAQNELSRADAEARRAADEVGRRLRGESEPALAPEPDIHAAFVPPHTPSVEVEEETSAQEPDAESPEPEAVPDKGRRLQSSGRARRAEPGPADAPIQAGDPAGAAGADSEVPSSPADEVFAKIRSSSQAVEEASQEPAVPASEAATTNGDESLLQRRESAVIDMEVGLTRKLKRALQDEQNTLLDRLRGSRGRPSAADLLPALDSQVDHYATASRALVEQAAAAGARFAAETLGNGAVPADTPSVDDLVTDTARSIVDPLRRRLEQSIDAGAGEDQSVLIESLGAAYREWKSQRIERIAGDVLAAAFSRGTWHATPEGVKVRWIVEDTDGPCPDCDDDALAGQLPKGESFPTGQHYPPAHSGCRCLLVPVAN
jgi:DivIVA domain-containing protein